MSAQAAPTFDLVVHNCNVATMSSKSASSPYGAIEQAVVAVKDGKIAFVGAEAAFLEKQGVSSVAETSSKTHDCGGSAWVTPSLIDCHTHLVYGGDRSEEWELKLRGASYEEVAKAGGGIVNTVDGTRAASVDDLVASAGVLFGGGGEGRGGEGGGSARRVTDHRWRARAANGGSRARPTLYLVSHLTSPHLTSPHLTSSHPTSAHSVPRLRALMREGVTAIEIKSGYGLTLEDERKQLVAAQRLGDELGVTVVKTFLGAHAVPREKKGREDEYIDDVCAWMPVVSPSSLFIAFKLLSRILPDCF